MRRSKLHEIGVVLPTELDFGREILRGISTFVTSSARWRLELISPVEDFVTLIKQLRPDGLIIGPVNDIDEAIAAMRAVRGPVVSVAANYDALASSAPKAAVVNVGADDAEVGRLAAEHFLNKGYRNFAFLGTPGWWSDKRRTGFESALAAAGLSCDALIQGAAPARDQRGWSLPHYGADVFEWLAKLPKPLAVLACNDLRGRELSEGCRTRGIRVPDDVAILGVDNDDLECVLAYPPLSSIAIPWRRIGFEAAGVLARGMRGRRNGRAAPSTNGRRLRPRVRGRVILVPPYEVVERQSTDTIAISDGEVSAAIRFIREHAHEPIRVQDLLDVVPAARRSLEKRFQRILSRSPAEEIRRAHVERAKRLLGETDLPLSKIADNSGFSSFAWFSKTFRDVVGETPSGYRNRFACR